MNILLSNESNKILHGETASKKAENTAKKTFKEGGLGVDLPEIRIKHNQLNLGINFLNFISQNKILSSKSEARRAIANKGIKIDNIVIEDEKRIIQLRDFKKNFFKLSHGKKKHFLIKII